MENLFLCDNPGGPGPSLFHLVPRRTPGKGQTQAVTPLLERLLLHHAPNQPPEAHPVPPIITPVSLCAPTGQMACTVLMNLLN